MKQSHTVAQHPGWLSVFAAAIFFAPDAAHAQNALGSGNALDANLSQQGPLNPSQSQRIQSELRFRNSIVTGNAPGGRSFRGNVGYTAPNDFRGRTGSDDLFEFGRDSFYSGLAAQGFQATDALRFQAGLTTLPTINRPSTAYSGSNLAGQAGRDALPDFNPLNIDRNTLRSTSEFLSNLSLTPSLVRTSPVGEPGQEGRGLRHTVASPLLGVSTQSQPGFAQPPGSDFTPTPGASEVLEDLRSPLHVSNRVESDRPASQQVIDELRQSRQERRRGADQTDQQRQSGPALPSVRPSAPGDQEDQPAGEPDLRQQLQQDLQQDAEIEQDASLRAPTIEERIEQLRQQLSATPKDIVGDREEEEEVESTLELLRQSRLQIDQFAPPASKERDLFAEHMHRAEQLLSQGRWFEAEERFTSALTMRPSSVMASAGRIHAQIGAGLFLSASVNLKQLLRQHPELIAVQYDASLLPGEDRLDSLDRQLRQRMADEKSPMARHAALLYAYLGHQIGDQQMVQRGFETIDRVTEKIGGDDRFFDVLRKVWTQ